MAYTTTYIAKYLVTFGYQIFSKQCVDYSTYWIILLQLSRLTINLIIRARLTNAEDDGFSKSFVKVSPTDVKVNLRFMSCTVVVATCVTAIVVSVVTGVAVVGVVVIVAVFEFGAVVGELDVIFGAVVGVLDVIFGAVAGVLDVISGVSGETVRILE